MTPFASVAMLGEIGAVEDRALQGSGLEQRPPPPAAAAVTSSMARTSSSPWWPAWSLQALSSDRPAADRGEGVFQFEIVEDGTLGDDVFEQPPQGGDVPLAVAQLVNKAPFGLRGRDVERLVEGAVGGLDAERGVEDQQGLADRVHDVLGVVLDVLDQRSSFHHARPLMLRGSPQ